MDITFEEARVINKKAVERKTYLDMKSELENIVCTLTLYKDYFSINDLRKLRDSTGNIRTAIIKLLGDL
jgi:hypothetical protein